MSTHQGALLRDPCGGTGLLTYAVFEPAHQAAKPWGLVDVPDRYLSIAVRCLCPKGQLEMNPTLPRIDQVVRTTEELQDLFPAGIPDILDRPATADDRPPKKKRETGPWCVCGHPLASHDDDLSSRPCMTKRHGVPCPCAVFRAKRKR